MSNQSDIIPSYENERQPEDTDFSYFASNIFIFGYLIVVFVFSLVPIVSLIWFVIRYCLDERDWERDIERYNQVRIIELVRASRSVCVNVRRSTIDKCEEVNV